MDKLKMHTPDNVADHILKIAELFPNTLTETIKDGKVVQQLVGVKSKAEIKKVIEETLA